MAPHKPVHDRARERQRLTTLRALRLFNREAIPALDALTRLAADLLQMPIACVSLVEEHELLFKSSAFASLPNVPRDISFCTHVVDGDGPMLVSDSTQDPRFRDNPLVHGPMALRFYAGQPIRHQGHSLGALCVLDQQPRQFDASQWRWLEALSECASAIIEQHVQAAQLEADEALFAQGPVVVVHWSADTRWRVTYCSRNLERNLGIAAETALGEGFRFLDHVHADDRAGFVQTLVTLRHPGADGQAIHYRWRKPDGRLLHLRQQAIGRYGDDGRLLGISAYLTDVSELTRSQALVDLISAMQRQYLQTHDMAAACRSLLAGLGGLLECSAGAVLEGVDRRRADRRWQVLQGWGPDADEPASWQWLADCDDDSPGRLIGPDGTSWLRFRLMAADEMLGLLVLRVLPVKTYEVAARRLEPVTDTLALLLRNHRDELARRQLEGHLRELASTDSLTGLANRASFFERLDRLLLACAARAEGFCLVLLDIDHFKQVNDRHGHPAGDRVLSALAGLLRQQLRTHDLVGRLGGEEFGLLLTQTAAYELPAVLERLRQAIQAAAIDTAAGTLNITVSLGALSVGAPLPAGLQGQAIYAQADAALYRAKEAGRNRWHVAGLTDGATVGAGPAGAAQHAPAR